MQSVRYQAVPYAVGGVSYPKARPATVGDIQASKRYGKTKSSGFKPMFFTHDHAVESEPEADLTLDWNQAASRYIAQAYADEPGGEKGLLFDILA